MSGALIRKLPGALTRRSKGRDVCVTRKIWWIQIVSEVKAQWSDGRLISHSESNGIGDVIVITLHVGDGSETQGPVRLMKTNQTGQHLLGPRKDVASVIKNRETDVVIQDGHFDIGEAQL